MSARKKPEQKYVIHTGEIGIESLRFRFELEGRTNGKTGFSLDTQALYCIGLMPDSVLVHLRDMCRQVGFRGISGAIGREPLLTEGDRT